MSYELTDPSGLGTNGAVTGAQVGGQSGGSSSTNTTGIIGAVGGALTSVVGGAITLASNIGLWRQQRRDVAGYREDAWAAEVGAINQDRIERMMAQEELDAQNAILEEQNRIIEEQERIMGLERQAIQAEMRRGELQAEQQARTAAALQFRMPTWGWYALAAVGVAAVIGAGAYMGTKTEVE